ncbi:MAG TPA: alanine--tRNA ligase [Candidatus Acidoferrales bacterium]|nr:alanine--tRNA ligase [Candidatus Acidoferrales bacterium]
MTGAEIRSQFIEFFRQRGHEFVPSAGLVPDKDPTLLFTNAGMVQFKNVFLGNEKRTNPRAVNSQRCLRLSGKHNDLEEVGRDGYHHTLFEMLGNWSFGDYYKREAIPWAWELLTKVWKLPKENLFATVYRTDDEAAALWASETDIAGGHIMRFDEKDNFWEMGDVGPCGPCSEIHIDRGPELCDKSHEAGHVCHVNAGCARYMELWNLVFIQYNRNEAGDLEELAAKHVDTGAGLERIASVLQGVSSNYDTDLFRNLIRFTESHCGRKYGVNEADDLAFRVVADHSRAITFLVTDGVLPGNEGRGYVLRRVLRRAARHAKHLGFDEPFLWKVTQAVVETMGDAFPEIRKQQAHVERVLRAEEERFGETLDKGLSLLEEERATLCKRNAATLPGDVAFKLYDTYGFPLDMTQDILRSDGISVDLAGFDACMEDQRQRARDARKLGRTQTDTLLFGDALSDVGEHSHFLGDRVYEAESRVVALHAHAGEQQEVREGDEVHVVTAETPFYAESGGQVGDRGVIETDRGDLIEIVDTQKARGDLVVHIGRVVRGAIAKGTPVKLRIDRARRDAARLNHTATHILHAVLRDHLGKEVRQAGSLVTPERLRFDFTTNGAISNDVLRRIEEDTNAHIRENDEMRVAEMSYDDAIKAGALAFFGDKYGDVVRVVRLGNYSIELCGGTHVRRAGDIGLFKLRSESGVAAGVRRIEALTGSGALDSVRQHEQALREVGDLVHGDDVAERVSRLLAQQRDLEKQLKQLQSKLAGSQSDDLLGQARQVDGMKVLAAEVEGLDDGGMRDLADKLRNQIGSGVVVLGTARGDRAMLLAAVTKDLTKKYHAGNIIKQIAPLIGGGGGGKPDLAQAGGKEPAKLREALEAVYQIVH